MPDGYKIPPHWHTQAEQLTILSGTFILHMGDTMDAPAHSLGVGAYHFLPGKMHHAAEAKGEAVLDLHGMAPFDIHYLNLADDPTKAAAAKSPRSLVAARLRRRRRRRGGRLLRGTRAPT